MDRKWMELTDDEKRAERFKRWLTPPDAEFSSPETEESYRKRVTRFIKTIRLEEPDRVPVILPAGNFPIYHAGMTLKEAMYDNIKLCQAYRKFFSEFEADTFTSPGMVPSGRASEIINSLSSKWPGHGLPDGASMHQFVEGEYMKADEYDVLLNDPSDFCLRYTCRVPWGHWHPLLNSHPFHTY